MVLTISNSVAGYRFFVRRGGHGDKQMILNFPMLRYQPELKEHLKTKSINNCRKMLFYFFGGKWGKLEAQSATVVKGQKLSLSLP